MVARLVALIIAMLILLLVTPVGAQDETPTPLPTTTPVLVVPGVNLEYYVITGTEQIASDLVQLGTPDAPEQPILFGFGALMLGCFMLIFVRVLVGSR